MSEKQLRRLGWIVMYGLILLLVFTTLRYFGRDAQVYFQPDVYVDRIVLLRVHLGAGILAVLVGPFQFWGRLRRRHKTLHRNMGKMYILAVLFSALCGLALATTAFGGSVSRMGFSLLAVVWGTTTVIAYIRIRSRNSVAHREWMIRSFAISLAFVLLRIWFPALEYGIGLSQSEAYRMTAWLCWVPNLIVSELYIAWFRRRETGVIGPAE